MENNEIRDVIRETVIATVQELRKNGCLRRGDDVALSQINGKLFEYYKGGEKDTKVKAALEEVKDDPYFFIIPNIYRDRMTCDWLSQRENCGCSTIWRNRKRLCLELYTMLF
jgi:hypothetical protein